MSWLIQHQSSEIPECEASVGQVSRTSSTSQFLAQLAFLLLPFVRLTGQRLLVLPHDILDSLTTS